MGSHLLLGQPPLGLGVPPGRSTGLLLRGGGLLYRVNACVTGQAGACAGAPASHTMLRLRASGSALTRRPARAGRRLYAPERERMYGAKKRRTARLAARAARRSRTLALAYSASVAASYLILVVNGAAAL